MPWEGRIEKKFDVAGERLLDAKIYKAERGSLLGPATPKSRLSQW